MSGHSWRATDQRGRRGADPPGQGIGLRMLRAMLAHGRALGCTEAWLGTKGDNVAARALYERAGGASKPLLLYEFALAPE